MSQGLNAGTGSVDVLAFAFCFVLVVVTLGRPNSSPSLTSYPYSSSSSSSSCATQSSFVLERKEVYPFCAGDVTPKEDFDADLECFLSDLLGGGVRGRVDEEL